MANLEDRRVLEVGRETTVQATGNPFAVWAWRQISSSKEAVSRWRKQAGEIDRFLAGHHFTPADEEQLRLDGRPNAVFNAASKWLRYLYGLETKSRAEVEFLPRNVMDEKQQGAADLTTKMHNWVVQSSNGDAERSRAFTDMVARGMGWTDVAFDRSRDEAGLITISRIDGHEMAWDINSTRPCLEDAKWVARIRQITKAEALIRWGHKHRGAILAATGRDNENAMPGRSNLTSEVSAEPVEGEHPGWSTLRPGNVEVVEFQFYEEVMGVYFVDPITGEDDWLAEEEFENYERKWRKVLAPALIARGNPVSPEIEHDRVIGRDYKRAILIGNNVVAGPFPLLGKRFTYNCMTGQWDEDKKLWYGFMRLLVDPQRYMTKFANQVMEVITRNAKGGLLAEIGALYNPQQAEDTWAKTGSITYLNDGALSRGSVVEKKGPSLPEGSVQMFTTCAQMLREVTGIDPEVSMGMGTGDEAQVTLVQRQASAQLLLAVEFESLRRYRFNEARTVFDHLQLVADDRVVRVGGQDDGQYIQLTKAPLFLEYDVVLDEGTRDPHVREEWMRTLANLAPMLIRTGNMLPEFIDFLPLPASLRRKLKKAMTDHAEAEQKAVMQGLGGGGRGKPQSFAEIQARARKVAAEAALAEAQAWATVEKIKDDKVRAQIEAQLKAMDIQSDERIQQQQVGIVEMKNASDEFMQLVKTFADGAREGGRQRSQEDQTIVRSLAQLQQKRGDNRNG